MRLSALAFQKTSTRASALTAVLHFSFLPNRTKKQNLSRCRELLGLNPALPEIPKKSPQDLMLELTGTDISRCPRCKQGTMVIVAELPKLRSWDSS